MGDLAFGPKGSGGHGGNIYQMERIYKRKFLDFSANINPQGAPPLLKRTIRENFHKILHYPDSDAEAATSAISRYWRIKEENVLIGNGSAELIFLLLNALRPKDVAIACPTFSEYERAARCVRSKVKFITLKEEENFTLNNFKAAFKADILFLCNPNNPTGNLIYEDEKAIDKFPAKLIIADEAFMDFLPEEKKHTLIQRASKDKRVLVLRTFTKFFALPGLRMGYLVARRDVVEQLKRHQVPWSVNSFAQLAGALLSDKEYMRRTGRLIEKERRFLFNELSKEARLTSFPSVANFLLVKLRDEKLSSSLLKERLIQKGILIRDCANFRGLNNKFIRVAVRSHKENLKFLEALREAL